jgi:hypothetical protein
LPLSNLKSSTYGLSPLSSTSLKLYSRLARHSRLFALCQKFAALMTVILAPFSNWIRLPIFTGWGFSKDLPRFSPKPFRERFGDKHVDKETGKHVGDGKPKQESSSLVKETLRFAQSDIALTERFTQELQAVHGHVHKTEYPSQSIVEFLHSRGLNHIHLEPGILDEDALAKAGITVSHEPDPAIRVGVTKAICGLADTGSILEVDGEGSPLLASLLPEIHLVVLFTSRIYPTLENAIHLARNTKSAVFITGPSATGDIESVHTIGVHGPGEVHVFLVDD